MGLIVFSQAQPSRCTQMTPSVNEKGLCSLIHLPPHLQTPSQPTLPSVLRDWWEQKGKRGNNSCCSLTACVVSSTRLTTVPFLSWQQVEGAEGISWRTGWGLQKGAWCRGLRYHSQQLTLLLTGSHNLQCLLWGSRQFPHLWCQAWACEYFC